MCVCVCVTIANKKHQQVNTNYFFQISKNPTSCSQNTKCELSWKLCFKHKLNKYIFFSHFTAMTELIKFKPKHMKTRAGGKDRKK